MLPGVGDHVGDYRLVAPLGRGGMAVVYAAERAGAASCRGPDAACPDADRLVALKLLAPPYAGQVGERARFAREASALAGLDSPHIVRYLDHGEHDGLPFLATRLVPGGDLDRRIRRTGALPVLEALLVAGQVAAALEATHRCGIVHRDVKPSNVLLRSGPDTFAYLCDFGIASRAGDPDVDEPGSVTGTLGYLAPECYRGLPATASTDVYAVGCLLWTAISGTPPYHASDSRVVARGHLSDAVPQWAARDPASLALNEVLRRALAKRPEARYRAMRGLGADLRRAAVLAHDSAEVRRPRWRTRSPHAVRTAPGTG